MDNSFKNHTKITEGLQSTVDDLISTTTELANHNHMFHPDNPLFTSIHVGSIHSKLHSPWKKRDLDLRA